jgi:long-chain acyl-CoA synthetase
MDNSVGLARLIAGGASAHPTKAAVVQRDQEYSYAFLDRTVAALAAVLRVERLAGERVALMLPNGLEVVCCYLACFRAGAIATPFNYRYAAPELERALLEAEPKWLVIHRSRLDVLAKVDPRVVDVCRVLVVAEPGDPPVPAEQAFANLLTGEAPPAEFAEPSAGSPAVMFFTSGSTGRPKGVVHTQASARAMLESTATAFGGVGGNDLMLVVDPQVHVGGFIGSLSVLTGGGTVMLLDGYDEARYVALMRLRRPTLICTHLDFLSKLVHWPGIGRDDFASLRGIFTGGDRVPEALQRRFIAVAGLPVQIGWGMTEAIWLTICREPRTGNDECIGRPVEGVAIRVTDPDGRDLPTGTIGELRVKGPMVMQGYWRNSEETARALEDGWLRTGDSGWCDADGVWWFAARLKELIVRNTSKITPGEVEAAIGAHPAVATSGVVGAPNAEQGEVPVAFVVLEPGRTSDEAELLAFLRERIATYKLPARIYFLESLPLTRSGKVDHLSLQALARGPT